MPRPLRIAHVTTWSCPDKLGGAERVVFEVARAQAGLGHRVAIVTGNHDGRKERETIDGVEFVRYPVPDARGLRFFLGVRGAAARALAATAAEVDLIHAHQPAAAAGAYEFARSGPTRKVVWSFYAPWSAERAVERAARAGWAGLVDRGYGACVARVDRALLSGADAIVVLSEFSRRQIAALAPGHERRANVIPPGVDARFAPGDREESRAALGIAAPKSAIVLGSVRRLVKRMGLDDLIRGLAIARSFALDARLVIAGEGPERETLGSLARALAIEPFVTFLGRVPDESLPCVYRAADLFVLPTRALEGFGMATLEAMACATPVLATEVGATPELLARFDVALAPVRPNPESLALGALEFVARRAAIESAARAAGARVRAEMTWRGCAERLLSLYETHLAGNRG